MELVQNRLVFGEEFVVYERFKLVDSLSMSCSMKWLSQSDRETIIKLYVQNYYSPSVIPLLEE